MVLKTRGLGTGATFSYAWQLRSGATPSHPGFVNALRYSSQSMNSTTIIIIQRISLIFAFAAQSSLSKVRNDNV